MVLNKVGTGWEILATVFTWHDDVLERPVKSSVDWSVSSSVNLGKHSS